MVINGSNITLDDRNEGIDMKRCPNCKRIYNDNDFYCLNDNYPLVKLHEEKLTNSKKMTHKRENSVLAENNSNVSWKEIFIPWAIVIAAFWLLSSCVGNSNNPREEKCQVCYKTFTNKDDVHSIIMTNMCENCYSNFKYKQDVKEELKKYEERYGN